MFRAVICVIGRTAAVCTRSVVHAILSVGDQNGSGWAGDGDGFEGAAPGVVIICKEKLLIEYYQE